MNKEIISNRLKYYLDEKSKVHVSLKNKRYARGTVKEIREESFVLFEVVFGEIIIFFSEVNFIDKCKPSVETIGVEE